LFSSVTHDLRTPLASIKAGVTTLLDLLRGHCGKRVVGDETGGVLVGKRARIELNVQAVAVEGRG